MIKLETYIRAKLEITEFTHDDICTEYDKIASSAPGPSLGGSDNEGDVVALGRPISGLGKLTGQR